MAKAKRKRKPDRSFAWFLLLMGLLALYIWGRGSVYPLVVQKASGVVCCEATCSEYYVGRVQLPELSKYGRRSYEYRSYFVLENGVSVRIKTSYLQNAGLSENELEAVVGTECTVYYADFPFFDGSYPLVAISNGEDLEISEDVVTAAYRDQAKDCYILLGVMTLALLIPWIWKLVKKHQKEKRKQEKRARRQMVLAARQKSEIEKNLKENEGSKHPNNE